MLNLLKIYATTPESEPQAKLTKECVDGRKYYQRVVDTARWSEVHGFEGSLIYSNNTLVDGWTVAQIILEHTQRLTPLVAVNPIYVPPYTLAKRIASLAFMYGRRSDINWIAGGFQNDLKTLGDNTPHDQRYERLLDYAQLVNGVLRSKQLFSHKGKYHTVEKIRMMPPIPEELLPVQLMSGTSPASIEVADKLGATKVKYAKPLAEYEDVKPNKKYNEGIRFGIIARDSSDEAWSLAHKRFPDDRTGHRAHVMATKATDSNWHKQLSDAKETETPEESIYWLKPFKTYKTFCPYLVGNHEEVAAELADYVALGHSQFILDIMPDEEDFFHVRHVFELVEQKCKDLLQPVFGSGQ